LAKHLYSQDTRPTLSFALLGRVSYKYIAPSRVHGTARTCPKCQNQIQKRSWPEHEKYCGGLDENGKRIWTKPTRKRRQYSNKWRIENYTAYLKFLDGKKELTAEREGRVSIQRENYCFLEIDRSSRTDRVPG